MDGGDSLGEALTGLSGELFVSLFRAPKPRSSAPTDSP